jgi:hypothetical protein
MKSLKDPRASIVAPRHAPGMADQEPELAAAAGRVDDGASPAADPHLTENRQCPALLQNRASSSLKPSVVHTTREFHNTGVPRQRPRAGIRKPNCLQHALKPEALNRKAIILHHLTPAGREKLLI